MTTVAPYGAWPSPITPELIVQAAVGLSEVWVEDPADPASPVWWSESRPEEAGRVQLVERASDGTLRDVLPLGFAARTRVHEYGGGAWWLHGSTVFFANWDDQRLYRLAPTDPSPVAITRPSLVPHGLRYADGRVTGDGRWSICVRESHEAGGEARNELVAVPTGGGDVLSLGTHSDFVSNPRPSPDGRWLAWLQWNHPDMPWDRTELWVAGLAIDEHDAELVDPRRVAGDGDEAITQPEWSPDGRLHYLSDREDWSNLWAFGAPGAPEPGSAARVVVELAADIGTPPWVFGMSRYAFARNGGEGAPDEPDTGRIVAVTVEDGVDRVVVLERDAEQWTVRALDPQGDTSVTCVKPRGTGVVAVAASFQEEAAVVTYEIGPPGTPARREQLRLPRDLGVDPVWWSTPRHIAFPTGGGHAAHGLFYPPTNPTTSGPPGERPPLLVAIHGGPTSAARSQLQLGIQFWTSRGFGVLDVNYRGSTGYGRDFRRLLDGAWGVADVEDCAAGAAFLASEGLVDGERLAIHGGSAGGFTTLMALITTDRFAAGTSSYGVTDLEALARDTHKFESRYLDRLVGPYPERRDLYVERSPIHHLDDLDDPILVLQGLEDEVVPPSQAELLVEAARRNGTPFAYLAFEGEQHGFRQASTIRRALEAELIFYARVLGFDPPADAEPLVIENL
jgi:dipeptidyl aminopeptidase/acylaminoacyl peptidase